MSATAPVRFAKSVKSDILQKALADYLPGHALPRAFYKDPEIFQMDMRNFVLAHWHCVGHVSMVKNPGDFFTVDIGEESIIIARGSDDQVRAMLNMCRHRGSRVCNQAEGHAKNGHFVCPYHAWTYDCSGDLQRARLMPPDFKKSDFGLKQVQTRVAEGMIFITFADEPLGFDHVDEAFSKSARVYGWANAKVAVRRAYVIDANWKLVVENYQECYHCGPAHQEYSKRHVFARPQEERVAPDNAMHARDLALGVPLDNYDASPAIAQAGQESAASTRSAMFEGYLTGSRDGKPVAPLMGQFKGKDYDGGFTFIDVGPTSNFVAYPDYSLVYRTAPLTADKTIFELIWLVDGDAVEGRDYNVDELIWMWDYTSDEDKKIIEMNQAGVNSAFFEPGPYTPMEIDAQTYIDWYIESMR